MTEKISKVLSLSGLKEEDFNKLKKKFSKSIASKVQKMQVVLRE